jgi:hypothetical protein
LTEFASSTQNPKKIIRAPNLPIKTKIFPKKYVWYLKSEKEPKIRMGATRRNLQAQHKIFKKIVVTVNLPITTKIFPKKYVWYLKSEKEPKIRMGPTRRNLPREPEKQ